MSKKPCASSNIFGRNLGQVPPLIFIGREHKRQKRKGNSNTFHFLQKKKEEEEKNSKKEVSVCVLSFVFCLF